MFFFLMFTQAIATDVTDGIEQLGLSNSAVFEKQCDQQNLNNAVR